MTMAPRTSKVRNRDLWFLIHCSRESKEDFIKSNLKEEVCKSANLIRIVDLGSVEQSHRR